MAISVSEFDFPSLAAGGGLLFRAYGVIGFDFCLALQVYWFYGRAALCAIVIFFGEWVVVF